METIFMGFLSGKRDLRMLRNRDMLMTNAFDGPGTRRTFHIRDC
jgi:hypothetical protein